MTPKYNKPHTITAQTKLSFGELIETNSLEKTRCRVRKQSHQLCSFDPTFFEETAADAQGRCSTSKAQAEKGV